MLNSNQLPVTAGQLRQGQGRIGIWGLGAIGISTLVNYAHHGVGCVGYDPDTRRVDFLRQGVLPIDGLEQWLRSDARDLLIKSKLTADEREILATDIVAHFICVPTEVDGIPTAEIIRRVTEAVAQQIIAGANHPPLIIVESTLTPGTSDDVIIPTFRRFGLQAGVDFHLCISPRRDWFTDGIYSVEKLERIFGVADPASTSLARSVLEIVSPNLHLASSLRVAELVKCVENAYRFIDITFANQLALAFPQDDVKEVLQLAGTKWNMLLYKPGLRPGGHCIPVAPRHLARSAERPGALTLIDSALNFEPVMSNAIADIISARGYTSALILGLSYRAGVKMPVFSPARDIVTALLSSGIDVSLCDPKFGADEIAAIAKCAAVELSSVPVTDVIVVIAAHEEFFEEPALLNIFEKASPKIVIDVCGALSNQVLPSSVQRYFIGDGQLLSGL